jgi:hypothetical protein
MDSLKFYLGPACPIFLLPAGHKAVSGVTHQQGGQPAAIFYLLVHPTPSAHVPVPSLETSRCLRRRFNLNNNKILFAILIFLQNDFFPRVSSKLVLDQNPTLCAVP